MDYSKAVTDFVAKTKDFTKTVSKKAVEIKDQAKINIDIASLQNKIDEDYRLLGKEYFNSVDNKENLPDEQKALFDQINGKMEQIEKLKSELNELKNCIICDECNNVNPKDAAYCSKCGKKFN